MPDHFAFRLASVRQFDVEHVDADDLACVLALRAERLLCKVVHDSIIPCTKRLELQLSWRSRSLTAVIDQHRVRFAAGGEIAGSLRFA